MSEQDKKKLTTSQLLTIIRSSKTFSEVDTALTQAESVPQIGQYIYQLMEKYKKQPKDVILQSGFERSYFYHILSGQKIPGRNILLRICFCLQATLTETNLALRYAGHAVLYPRIRRDALLIYAINHKYTVRQANQKLIEEGEVPLYQEGKFYG